MHLLTMYIYTEWAPDFTFVLLQWSFGFVSMDSVVSEKEKNVRVTLYFAAHRRERPCRHEREQLQQSVKLTSGSLVQCISGASLVFAVAQSPSIEHLWKEMYF